jgi:hypothetical protein
MATFFYALGEDEQNPVRAIQLLMQGHKIPFDLYIVKIETSI